MAGLWGFASHGGSILSRGWLATVEASGYPRHLGVCQNSGVYDRISKLNLAPNRPGKMSMVLQHT